MALPHAYGVSVSRGFRLLPSGALRWAMATIFLWLTTVQAQSPLVAELEIVAVSYHNDPTRLDYLRNGLEHTIKIDSRVENLVALARVSFIWGDIRAATDDQKVAAYERGRQVAKRVIELAPGHVEGRFWYALNTARWGQIKGVVRSLFLLPSVQQEIQTILQLDPKFTPV
jgi:hypothetical protein